jgi:translation initiation factor IF-3
MGIVKAGNVLAGARARTILKILNEPKFLNSSETLLTYPAPCGNMLLSKKKLSASHLAAPPARLILCQGCAAPNRERNIPRWHMGRTVASVFCYVRRCIDIAADLMINEEIRDREVRVISPTGDQLGVMTSRRALELAEEQSLDLVKIVANAHPPVCKLMDYDKYRFETAKREREIRKNQKIVTLKEVQLSATIEEADVQVKAKAALKFLQDGDKVKVSIRFRGRQITHSEIGVRVMNDFMERVKEFAVMERRPLLEGRHMIMILSPKDPARDAPAKPAPRNAAPRPAPGQGTQQPAAGQGAPRPVQGQGMQQPATGQGAPRPVQGQGGQYPGSGQSAQRPAQGQVVQRPGLGQSAQHPSPNQGAQTTPAPRT